MRIFGEKVLLVFSILGAVLLLVSLGLIYFNAPRLSEPLILHFDQFRGIDLFGNRTDFWLIWLSGFIMVLLNTFLGYTFYERERVLTYIFAGANVLIAILVLIISATIISVN